MLAQLLPVAILLTALCLGLVWLGLIVSYLGLFVIYLVTTLPFCIWEMKRNYDTISLSFEEAAEIDGASAWQSFSHILLPLGAPALAVTGLFSLFVAWNEYVIGAIFCGIPRFPPSRSWRMDFNCRRRCVPPPCWCPSRRS